MPRKSKKPTARTEPQNKRIGKASQKGDPFDRGIEEALRESEKTFRLLVENSPDVIMKVDRESRILFINYTLPEYTVESVLGKPAVGFLSAEDGLRYMQALHEVFDSGEPREVEVGAVGATSWLSRLVPIKNDGRVESAMVIATNITERRRAEEALRENQRTLSTLMSNLPGMAYRCRNDADWTVEFVSEGCYDLTGYHPSDLIGNRTVSYGKGLIHPDDQEPVWNDVQAGLREKRPFQLVYRITTASGQEKWVWEQGRGIFSTNGDLLALEGFVTDITERQRAEEALRKSEAKHLALLNAMPDMMFRISKEGVYLEFIPAKEMEPLLPSAEFLGKNIKETLPDHVARQAVHYMDQALETGDMQIFEYELLLNGNRRDYEARIVVSGDDEVMAIVRDITDRKAQAAALEYQALHDLLTDLPNRTLVLDRLKQAIHAASRENKPLALLLMDLDRFKDVNDALGHHHGDLLLK
ncbi:MAG TPA: PAS domain S-box protein, partial [Nitrospiria bacterium]